MLKLGGRVTRDETTVRAALVKKFWQVSIHGPTTHYTELRYVPG